MIRTTINKYRCDITQLKFKFGLVKNKEEKNFGDVLLYIKYPILSNKRARPPLNKASLASD
jgi:hypothetical protein